MFYVDARYHRDPSRVSGQIRYISHREEDLADGRRRALYGIGARYRALRGDEHAIRTAFREDARPRGTGENRPLVDGSKPATTVGRDQLRFTA